MTNFSSQFLNIYKKIWNRNKKKRASPNAITSKMGSLSRSPGISHSCDGLTSSRPTKKLPNHT